MHGSEGGEVASLPLSIITSQLPVSQWYDYLNNNTVADVILDRVVHSSHRIEIEGDSMRKVKSNINTNYEDLEKKEDF